MQIHELKPVHKLKRKKRVGRGGKRGTYSGRGMKGQKSRAGAKMKAMERQLILRLPKLRGVKFKARKQKPIVLNMDSLANHFSSGEIITPKTLLERGVIKKIKGRLPKIKILGKTSSKKKLSFAGVRLSASARKQIEASGGTIK